MNSQNLIFLNLILSFSMTLSAQVVSTVAGVLETPGFNDGPALSARFFNPHGIAVDDLGNIYVVDRYNHTIRKVSSDGITTTLAGKPGEPGSVDGHGSTARFNEPWGLCVSASGVLYVADKKNNKIRSVTQDGVVKTMAGTGNFGTTDGPSLAATFGNPTDVEVDDEGNLFIVDHLTHIIRKIDTNGRVSTLAGIPYIPGAVDGQGRQAQFWRPYGLTLDNDGNILVADEWNHKIRKVTPNGNVTTIAGIGEAGLVNGKPNDAAFNFPWDVAVDDQNNIYIGDGYNYVIRKISSDGEVSNYVGSPLTSGGVDGEGSSAKFNGATSLAWSPFTNSLYVGDPYNHLIREVKGAFVPSLELINLTGTTQICQGEEFSVRAGTTAFDNYAFYIDGVLAQNSESSLFTSASMFTGTFQIYVASFWQGELKTSNTLTLEVLAGLKPNISAVGATTFYEGDSVILVASGTGDFLWSNQDTTQTITVKESGFYTVQTFSEDACSATSEGILVEVILQPDPAIISVVGSSVICPGSTTMLASNYENGNQWLKDGWSIPASNSNFLEVNEPGFYQVQAEDPITGVLVFSEAIEIKEGTLPSVNINFSEDNISPEDVVQFTPGGADMASYFWDFGDIGSGEDNNSTEREPSHQYNNPGQYTIRLIVTNESGCSDTIIQPNSIAVFAERDLFIPTAFTPNDDGINDIFIVRGKLLKSFNIKIYNQWGGLLYSGINQEEGWDGKTGGKQVNSGTYTYLIAFSLDGNTEYTSGHITLLR